MTAAIILAAGESSRLGQPKQNLLFNGETLLKRVVTAAEQSYCKPIIVVLGANYNLVKPVDGTTSIYNDDWKEGMASSIRLSITEIKANVLIDKVIILLCDQPFISAELLNAMFKKQLETGKPIVACAYNDTIGVPVLFNSSFFSELLLLRGPEGARKILEAHSAEVATVIFDKGSVDIDTMDDYRKLIGLDTRS